MKNWVKDKYGECYICHKDKGYKQFLSFGPHYTHDHFHPQKPRTLVCEDCWDQELNDLYIAHFSDDGLASYIEEVYYAACFISCRTCLRIDDRNDIWYCGCGVAQYLRVREEEWESNWLDNLKFVMEQRNEELG